MTTREEYAEAADEMEEDAKWCGNRIKKAQLLLATRVLRALADGAVLCERDWLSDGGPYRPIEEQP